MVIKVIPYAWHRLSTEIRAINDCGHKHNETIEMEEEEMWKLVRSLIHCGVNVGVVPPKDGRTIWMLAVSIDLWRQS